MSKAITATLPEAMPLPPFSRLVMGVALTLARWEMNLKTRNALQKLDDHLLKDVGLNQAMAQGEWNKPFWWG